MSQKNFKIRVLFPIGAKLVIIITILLLASLGAVIFMVSALSTQDAQRTAEANNFTINIRAGSQAESSFHGVREAVFFYLEMLDRIPAVEYGPEMERFFFYHNQNIATIGVINNENIFFIHNELFLDANGIDIAAVEEYLSSYHSVADTLRLFNASPVFQLSLLTATFIRHSITGDETVKVLFSPYDLFESFSTGTNTSFLINSYGSLLLHSDIFLVLGGANFSSLPIVETMLREGDNNRQISYEYQGVMYFGAYYRLTGTDATVITVISHDIVFEAVQGITRQNIFLSVAVLFIAISFIWFFSKTISKPARILADAAVKIEEGDFNVSLTPQTRDELGLLTNSFDKMSSALNIFGRFTNKDIAVRAMRGEIVPGGFPKHATIFFSDIRNFTEKTENFTKSFGDEAPNRIVLWLNEYFSHMIDCIGETGGVVDKFIGDAVMAHWGTASSTGSSSEDAYNCVRAALMMRDTLIQLNAHRSKDATDNPVIRIGCGINTGTVIAGQIGSEDRMEYTVIGDPVNLASRVESLSKPFGTDILITENTWELIKDKFITEEMPAVTVKGKEKPVKVFAVINFKDSEDGPQTLMQVRELLGIETPDIDKLVIFDEEKNYRFSGQSGQGGKGSQNNAQDYRQKSIHGNEKAGTSLPNVSTIKMTSFGSSACVQGPAGKHVPVFFSWTTSKLNAGTNIVVEISEDQDFNSILEDREVIGELSVSIPLYPGKYWWRVYPVGNIGSNDHHGGEQGSADYPSGVLVVDTNDKERIKIYKN